MGSLINDEIVREAISVGVTGISCNKSMTDDEFDLIEYIMKNLKDEINLARYVIENNEKTKDLDYYKKSIVATLLVEYIKNEKIFLFYL